MQKLLTITINIEKLQEASKGAFTVTEIEEVNTLLDEGWVIEEWEFITSEKETEKAVMLLILNDEETMPDYDMDEFMDSDFDQEEEAGDENDDADADVHPNMQ